jgi:NAD-dependent DNA ligase
MSAAVKKIVAGLQTDYFATMSAMTKKQFEGVMKYLGEEYYNEGVSHISDADYDRLRETLGKKYGLAEAAPHMEVEVTKQKVKLPFFMGSMDKIKPDKNNLVGWIARYPGQVCISDKLDGVSGLRVKSGGKHYLFTRGNGTIGQDISHLIPFINCGDIPGVETYAVRGELIVTKAKYESVKGDKRGARQMVSGLTTIKTLSAERKALLALVDFVAYEVIVPEGLKASDQFKLLDKKSTFTTVPWSVNKELSIEKLGDVLGKRKAASPYEIDGIIVSHDAAYPRVVGRNPEHAFAFKMSFAEQQAVTEVLQVIWEASKDGYLKPTVNFEPVNIAGVVIQYATGFNAAFIHAHGLGPGAFIEIIRSGDVIPYIKAVKSVAPGGPSMPSVKWHWNETHVDAVLDNVGENPDVQKRALLYFAQTLEIGYCGEGNITKMYDGGVHSIQDMLNVTAESLIAGGGFAKASAAKLVAEIDAAKKKATITQWAVGSGIFGRGIGTKRTEVAFGVVPRDLSVTADLVDKVVALGGWSRDSAEGFVSNLPEFKKFMTSIGVKAKAASPAPVAAAGGKLTGQVILFTGFHPKDLEEAVVRLGGSLADTWGKKVTVLVIKDATVNNEKTKKAIAAGVPVKTADEFRKML